MELFEGSLPLVGGAEGFRGCEQGFSFQTLCKAAVVAASDDCNAHLHPKTSRNLRAVPNLKYCTDKLAQYTTR